MEKNIESASTATAPEVPLFHWKSYRMYLLFILMITFGITSCNSMNLGITLTCMVDARFYEKENVVTTSEECPGSVENRTDLGYTGNLQWTPFAQSQLFAVFFWTNLFTMLVSGSLSDRFNAKYLVLAAITTFSVLSLLSPLLVSIHYYAFLVSRGLMGICESFTFPCMTTIVAHWIPPNERSTAAAIYTSGHQLASLVAVLVSSKLCLFNFLGGWPLVFYFFGICGAFAAAIVVTLVSNRPEESRLISQKELNYVHEQLENEGLKKKHEKKMPVPWRSIFTSPVVHAIMAAEFSYQFSTSIFINYLPSFFRDVMAFDVQDNGVYTALPFIVQIIAKFAVSITIDKLRILYGINVSTSCKVLQTISSIGTACVFISMGLFLDCTQVMLAKILVVLFGVFFAGEIAGAFTATLYIAPSFTGTISSITASVGSVAGILCPTVIGIINKHGTRQEWSHVFFCGAAVNIITGLIFLIFGSAKLQPWAVEQESKSKVYQLDGNDITKKITEKS
ncbi:MFS domain-containing protein [Aphelenchoides bicaudatus]|nr:MFS domain-containing protein [Aphelenchoides bicaudatus]